MNNGLLFVISGPSGTGKGTVVKQLCEKMDNIGLSISATTRDIREGEENGVSYYFISKAEFEKLISEGKMLEYNKYVTGNYYGTPISEVERILSKGNDLILEIEPNGAAQVKEKWPDVVRIMIVPPSMEELELRLRGRGTETEESISARMARAKEEMSLCSEYDYIVLNEENKIDECVDNVMAVITAEHLKAKRMLKEI